MLLDVLKTSSLADQAQEISSNAIGAIELVKSFAVGSQERIDLVHGFVKAIFYIWVALLPFLAVAAVAGIFTQALDLDRILMTEQGVDYGNEKEKKRKKKLGGVEEVVDMDVDLERKDVVRET